ncbi:MAG: Spi family protease inhibitor [Alistipes putredinis]
MQGLLEAIDAPAEDGAVTRSGGIRRVKNVTTVSPEALSPGGTRSEATADVEDLLYIVNFENEAGYAILGADDRLEPVYAVVDEGSLTTEEFRYAVTVTPEQAEADGELVFPLQMVAQAAIGRCRYRRWRKRHRRRPYYRYRTLVAGRTTTCRY